MKKHTNYIIEYENFVSEEKIDEILHLCKTYVLKKNIIFDERNKNRSNDAHYLASYNDSVIQYLNKQCSIVGYQALLKYYKDCSLIKYSIMHEYGFLSNYVYRFYDTNDQYNWHIDKSHTDIELKISFILYLNDDFEGGNTLFLNDKLKVTPKKGSALLFPCGPYFLHKSTPVKSGQKHIIWNCFGQSVYENKLTADV